jgi:CxxC motif-containing protein (DUF1111 family)
MASRTSCFALLFAFVGVLEWSGTRLVTGSPPDKQKARLELGKELFSHEWTVGDRRSHHGDGLGPVYNAQSCAACHRMGRTGGAGTRETDVSLVSVFVSEKINGALAGLLAEHPLPIADGSNKAVIKRGKEKIELEIPDRDKLAAIHPALLSQASFPLHRFGAGSEFREWKAGIFPNGDTEIDKQHSNRRHTRNIDHSFVTLVESKRNTPALFGAGLIDAIPQQVLADVAAEQAKAAGRPPARRLVAGDDESPLLVKGRTARLKDGRIGRFGWKGNVASLRDFTLQACSSELGLEVPGFAKATPPWKKNYKAPGLDLTGDQCDALTLFVAALPKPQVRRPDSPQQAVEIEHGRKLFASIGCADCHRPKLGEVDGIYSDLLLHDMGGKLSDSGSYAVFEPEIASQDNADLKSQARISRAANEREWRTPPLWGLRDSAPYLHDGRADTVADAVALHGGEGLTASQAFRRLSAPERQQVELFLQSLVAPPSGL